MLAHTGFQQTVGLAGWSDVIFWLPDQPHDFASLPRVQQHSDILIYLEGAALRNA